jgi:hypothetical protein
MNSAMNRIHFQVPLNLLCITKAFYAYRICSECTIKTSTKHCCVRWFINITGYTRNRMHTPIIKTIEFDFLIFSISDARDSDCVLT